MDCKPLLEIVQVLEPIVQQFSPQVVYTHHHGDLNIDHRLTNAAVMTACRPLPNSTLQEIYGFEVLSSTEWASLQGEQFIPNVFVDIDDYWSLKLQALNAYADEMRLAPHSRSIDHISALAVHRGHSVGVAYAEAFTLIRSIRR